MTKYNYPDNWKKLSPLERDDWHRHMGAFGRRIRFLEELTKRDPEAAAGLFWQDGQWKRRTKPTPWALRGLYPDLEKPKMTVYLPNNGILFMDVIV